MEEFLRKYVSSRLLALSEGELQPAQQQCENSVVSPREGPKHLPSSISSYLTNWRQEHLTRIKMDERNCFVLFVWRTVRNSTISLLPKHAAVAGWKHRALSSLEQKGAQPMPRDRGAEQGDVDGPWNAGQLWEWWQLKRGCALRCNKPLELSAGSARATHCTEGACRINNAIGRSKSKTFSSAGKDSLEVTIRDTLCKKNPRLADQWYLDDGDIQCHPLLVLSYPDAFDAANVRIGGERNPQKTEVIYHVADRDTAPVDWKINDVRLRASNFTAVHGNVTLGVAAGPRLHIADQLTSFAPCMNAQLCQDPQTELAIRRESLGVSRINHIFRLHSHTNLQEREAAKVFDEIRQTLSTEDSSEQATLSASQAMMPAQHTSELSLQPRRGFWI